MIRPGLRRVPGRSGSIGSRGSAISIYRDGEWFLFVRSRVREHADRAHRLPRRRHGHRRRRHRLRWRDPVRGRPVERTCAAGTLQPEAVPGHRNTRARRRRLKRNGGQERLGSEGTRTTRIIESVGQDGQRHRTRDWHVKISLAFANGPRFGPRTAPVSSGVVVLPAALVRLVQGPAGRRTGRTGRSPATRPGRVHAAAIATGQSKEPGRDSLARCAGTPRTPTETLP